ncbi:SpoIIE family protein phosphatase [Desulfobacterales bacterium HSG2]|nr:SpoIIE family protein phosphatase [Desulfobacterales bacterium HSG2]
MMNNKDKMTEKLQKRIRKLEAALRIVSRHSGKTEVRMRKQFEVVSVTIPAPMIISKENGEIIFANLNAQKTFGYSCEEFAGLEESSLYNNPDDRQLFLETLLKRGEAEGFRVELRKSEDSVFPATLFSQQIYFDGQDCILTIVHDLTEVMTLEKQLRETWELESVRTDIYDELERLRKENKKLKKKIRGLEATINITSHHGDATAKSLEEQYRQTLDIMPVPVVISVRPDGRFLHVNRRTCAIFGFSYEEFLKLTAPCLYENPEDRERFLHMLTTDGKVNDFEVNMKKSDGSVFPVSLFCEPVTFQNEPCLLTVIYDLKERKRAEAKINELQRVLTEMEIAVSIQAGLLPKEPKMEGYEISAYMKPAEYMGGDYYDIINFGDMDWIVIGDVSGHGVPAGLVMIMVQTAIHVALSQNAEIRPSALLTVINRIIEENIRKIGESKHMSITVFSVQKMGEFTFSGLHEDTLIYRAESGNVERVETNGMWIGIVDDIEEMLEDDVLALNPGDVMLLYTDGITEATRKDRGTQFEMFGDDRLRKVFRKLGNRTAEEIRTGIIEALQDYNWEDDVTMLVLKRSES